jgi:pimeloyl-ACP methyl ester carboxylesterase
VRGALAVVLTLAAAAPASAALKFSFTCGGNLECAHLSVPIDRSGAVPGTIKLRIDRIPAERPQGAIFAIAGGPGQGATTIEEGLNTDVFKALGRRDLVVIDQRGTGSSGPLDCPTIDGAEQDAGPLDERTVACAEFLGPRRNHYTTADTVADFEAVRQALGIDRITLYGVSYGTDVALSYAATYPEHVERLILDSVVDPQDTDPFELSALAALPRILTEICRGQCTGITGDLAGDVATLVDRLPVRGRFVDSRGRVRTTTATARDLYSTIRAADLDPFARSEYPAAVHAAVSGDTAPLLRMLHRFDEFATAPAQPNQDVASLSFSLQAATLCEEAPLPWERTAAPEQRDAQTRATADAIPDASFEPFDRATMLFPDNNNLLFQCRRWPALAQAPAVPKVSPDVPVLVLEGLEDTRTPLEVGRAVAARFPHAQVLAVPKTAHAVSGRRGCARTAIARFMADRSLAGLCAGLTGKPLRPLPPVSLAAVQGGAVAAIKLTLDDLSLEASLRVLPPIRGGGLHGGFFSGTAKRLRVHAWSYVPKLAISSGRADPIKLAGRYAVHGPTPATSGALHLTAKGTLAVTLGGKRVVTRWKPPKNPLFG